MQSTATGLFPAASAAPVSVAAPSRAGRPQSVSSPAYDVIPVTRREGRGPGSSLSLPKEPVLSLSKEPALSLSKGPDPIRSNGPAEKAGPATQGPGSPLPGSPFPRSAAGTGPGSHSGGGHGSPSGIVGEGLKPSPTAWRRLRFSVRGVSKAGSGPRISARLLSRRHCRGGFETLPYARWRRPAGAG